MPPLWSRRQGLRLLGAAPWLWPAGGWPQADQGPAPLQRRPLRFPRDHGSHLDTRTEWWYLTGWLRDTSQHLLGVQVTFFRTRVEATQPLRSRLAARHLLFAHAALTEVGSGAFRHEQALTRWSGLAPPGPLADERAVAWEDDTHVRLPGWSLHREPQAQGRYLASVQTDGMALELVASPTQAVLLQGEAGWSRKGPEAAQASFYYTQPQLALQGQVRMGTDTRRVTGRAWLDHEWSVSLLHPQAVGWDWVGINGHDGSALTAFRLRTAQGETLWTGGSWRPSPSARAAPAQAFGSRAVRFVPQRHWVSPQTGIRYPVDWHLHTPVGAFELHALLDAQELDSRPTTGTIYWEGLSELRVLGAAEGWGLGYLEMTGYGDPIRLG
jgi:predicted secreted hydrolase